MSENNYKYTLEIPVELEKELKRIKKQYGLTVYWQLLEGLRLFVDKYPDKK